MKSTIKLDDSPNQAFNNIDFSKINKLSRLDNFLLAKILIELDIGRDYKITAMKMADTKFGSQIVVELDNELSFFLPEFPKH